MWLSLVRAIRHDALAVQTKVDRIVTECMSSAGDGLLIDAETEALGVAVRAALRLSHRVRAGIARVLQVIRVCCSCFMNKVFFDNAP